MGTPTLALIDSAEYGIAAREPSVFVGENALVHDRGGMASLAIGPAQVRYESLVPMSALSDVLWAESQRLRAPTVVEAEERAFRAQAKLGAGHPARFRPAPRFSVPR